MSAILIIGTMLFLGAKVNRKKLTHEFYMEKISEEKQKQTEEKAKAAQKAANEAKRSKMWEFNILLANTVFEIQAFTYNSLRILN